MISFQIPGEPLAFARAGKQGKRHFTPAPQAQFMGVVKMFAQRALEGQPPATGPLRMTIRADYLPPASWPQKKREKALWKTSKPDADNLAKIVKDALNKVVYLDDAQIAELTVQKRYCLTAAALTVSIERLD
jgi:Holliday junction resolvase RusA-like endonuclease